MQVTPSLERSGPPFVQRPTVDPGTPTGSSDRPEWDSPISLTNPGSRGTKYFGHHKENPFPGDYKGSVPSRTIWSVYETTRFVHGDLRCRNPRSDSYVPSPEERGTGPESREDRKDEVGSSSGLGRSGCIAPRILERPVEGCRKDGGGRRSTTRNDRVPGDRYEGDGWGEGLLGLERVVGSSVGTQGAVLGTGRRQRTGPPYPNGSTPTVEVLGYLPVLLGRWVFRRRGRSPGVFLQSRLVWPRRDRPRDPGVESQGTRGPGVGTGRRPPD